MSRRALTIKATFFTENQALKTYLLIAGLFFVLVVLEYATTPDYVFGYLYTGPILLASLRLNLPATLPVTFAAVALTLLNLLIPGIEAANLVDLSNRLIAVLALIITAVLGYVSRQRYDAVIEHQQAKLKFQEQLANIREDFVSTLTRDLKTPLLGAITALKSLQQGNFGEILSAQREVLEVMFRSHVTTVQLLQTMLDVYHNDTEGLRLHLARVDLVELAQESIADLTELANSRSVRVALEIQDQLMSIWADGDALQLERVFTNLLTNAINYARRNGEVRILLEADPHHHTVKIFDDGLAIPEEELPFIFERFYCGDSDRQDMGLGLGLYLCRQIVEAHNGTIWAGNQPSRGVLFCFRLPASSAWQ